MKFINTLKGIPKFFREVKEELRKVSWSTRKEILGATWVVIFTTFILAVYIGLLDFGLSKSLTVFLR